MQERIIDFFELPELSRQQTVLDAFRVLGSNEYVEVVSDHEPRELLERLHVLYDSSFSWRYVEFGPRRWRVKVGKTSDQKALKRQEGCCGLCGGSE